MRGELLPLAVPLVVWEGPPPLAAPEVGKVWEVHLEVWEMPPPLPPAIPEAVCCCRFRSSSAPGEGKAPNDADRPGSLCLIAMAMPPPLLAPSPPPPMLKLPPPFGDMIVSEHKGWEDASP